MVQWKRQFAMTNKFRDACGSRAMKSQVLKQHGIRTVRAGMQLIHVVDFRVDI